MPAPRWLTRFGSRRTLLVLLFVGLALALGGRHAWAWYQLWAGRNALARYQPDLAQQHLASCLKVWPSSMQANLLASRADRQSGDFPAADRHLRASQLANGGTSEAIALEWALLQAASGNLREVDEFLQHQVEQEPKNAPLIWEAVAEGYIRLYRMLDALPCLERWLAIDPGNLRALELRGKAYQIGKQVRKGADDFLRVLELDPARDDSRRRLVLCLVEMGSYEDAVPHLERLEQRTPDDSQVQILLARCHNMRGRGEKAREIIDTVLRAPPDNALALRTRGQFALTDRQPADAERWLREAVEVSPEDYQAQWLLLQALQQQNKTEEARAQLARTEQVKERAEQFGDLTTRKLFEQPLDPALHYKMGLLLMQRGQKKTAEGWLLSALRLDPDYQPAHAALAEYYRSEGDMQRAEQHRPSRQ